MGSVRAGLIVKVYDDGLYEATSDDISSSVASRLGASGINGMNRGGASIVESNNF